MRTPRFDSTPLKLSERAFALPMIIFFAILIFILISSLWLITSQESDQSMKYVLKIKGEGISEAIHTFLMSECYSCSWDNRFYSSEVAFSETNPSTKDAVKKMVAATNKMIDEDRFIKGLLTYNGWINSIYSTADGLRIIQIKVKIETTGLVSKTICEHDYYDLYKRDLLDSLGETIGIFYDQENKDKNEHGVPPEVSACFKKSNAGVITDFKYQPKAVDTSNILK